MFAIRTKVMQSSVFPNRRIIFAWPGMVLPLLDVNIVGDSVSHFRWNEPIFESETIEAAPYNVSGWAKTRSEHKNDAKYEMILPDDAALKKLVVCCVLDAEPRRQLASPTTKARQMCGQRQTEGRSLR